MLRGSRIGLGLMALFLGGGLVGCGTASAAAGPTHPSRSQKATTTAAASSTRVQTGTVTIAGKRGTVLTTASGRTLYWFTADTATHSHCIGSCAAYWHPLLTTGSTVKAPAGVSGTFTVVADTHGHQVAYNGHLLYTYVGDTAAGQAKGQGLALNGGKWWVTTPGLTAGATAVATSGSGWSGSGTTASSTTPTSSHPSGSGSSGW